MLSELWQAKQTTSVGKVQPHHMEDMIISVGVARQTAHSVVIVDPYPPQHGSQALPISFGITGLRQNQYQLSLLGHLFTESEARSVDISLLFCDCRKLKNLAALAIFSSYVALGREGK